MDTNWLLSYFYHTNLLPQEIDKKYTYKWEGEGVSVREADTHMYRKDHK